MQEGAQLITKTGRDADRFAVLWLIVFSAIGVLLLFELTMLFSFSTNLYIFGFVLLYIILPPFLTSIRHVYTYFILLPVPCLGSWLMSMVFLSSFGIPMLGASVLVSVIPIALVASVHIFSRNRNMIGKRVPIASFSRYSVSIASGIFFIVGVGILGPTPLELGNLNKGVLYGFFLFAYVTSSMLYVNLAYRYRAMCRELGTNRIEQMMPNIWREIRERFPNQEKEIDLLQYYFAEVLRLFEEGNYEMAFSSGYKVINEETVVNPRDFVSDKREGEPSSFSEIRTILMHSRRKEVQINVRKIRETKRRLPQYCLELLKRDIAFLRKLNSLMHACKI